MGLKSERGSVGVLSRAEASQLLESAAKLDPAQRLSIGGLLDYLDFVEGSSLPSWVSCSLYVFRSHRLSVAPSRTSSQYSIHKVLGRDILSRLQCQEELI